MAIENISISTTEAESIYSKSYDLRTKSLYITNESFLSRIFSKGTSFNKIRFINSGDLRLLYTQIHSICWMHDRVIYTTKAYSISVKTIKIKTILPW